MEPAEITKAYRRHVPDITDAEALALTPVIARGDGPLRRLLRAYRAGVEHGRTHAATPAAPSTGEPS